MKRIYLVEDEKNLRNLLEKYLVDAGYSVASFEDGMEAKSHLSESPDMWILDIMMPGVNGYELIKLIKESTPSVPVIFMSARSQEIDRVIGLEMGSDDYLPKPFLPRELVLRVNRILKTSTPTADSSKVESKIALGSAVFDKEKRTLSLDGTEHILSTKEYDILNHLIKNKEKALSRNDILDDVWGEDYFGSERVVDDTIRRLRKKAPDIPIETVYGFGYILRL